MKKEKITRFVFLFFNVLIWLNGSAQKNRPTKPNFVFILVDDLGYSDLGCTGSRFYETPNIDKLARQSARFTRAYAACQVCSPSRASILTGVYPTKHGITDYLGAPTGTQWRKQERFTKLLPAFYQPHLALDFLTFPEVLKHNGYTTFFAGKWHLGDHGFLPGQQGFDVNKGGNAKGWPENYFSPYSNDHLSNGPPGENLDMRLAGETVKFISENKNRPFLVYLSFFAVHSPIQTTEEKWKRFRDKAEQQGLKSAAFKMERRLPVRQQQDNPVYAGLVSTMDDAVGNVLTALENLKLDQNTIVIFTSDNGGVVSGDNFSTNLSPLRGGKGYQWEGGLRVPLFIKVPWLSKQPLTIDEPVSGIDFFPSILSLANIKSTPAQQVDGISLVPLLENKKTAARPLYWHYPHYGNQGGDPSSILQSGNWKLIHYWEDDTNELYDLKMDTNEQHNLAATHPAIEKKMFDQLMAWLKETKALLPPKDPDYDPGKEQVYREKVKNEIWPRQEKIRHEMLQKTWKPNKNWWGSQP